jgi:hypothetical protein
VLLPTLVLTKDNFVCDRVEGFDELGGRDDFAADVLERRLAKHAVIDYEEASAAPAGRPGAGAGGRRPLATANKANRSGRAIYASASNRRADQSDDEDDDEDDD